MRFVNIPSVVHVGSLRLEDRVRTGSLEANLLSVSVDPDEWAHLLSSTEDRWYFTRDNANFLDATALTDEDEQNILNWALGVGFVQPVELWKAWYFDGESDDWRYMLLEDRASALNEIDDQEEIAEEDSPTGSFPPVEPFQTYELTEEGLRQIGRWQGPGLGLEAAIILYAEHVLGPERPDLVGVWWDEEFNPDALSVPRGGLLKQRLHLFEIEGDLGERPPKGFLEYIAHERDKWPEAAPVFRIR